MTTKVNSSVLDFNTLDGYAPYLKVGNANVSTLVTGLTSANVTVALGSDPVNVAVKVTGLTSANVTTALGSDPVNVAIKVTGLTSANVTTALGYTPISATSNVDTTVRSLGVGTAPSGTVGEIRAIDNITGYYSSDARLKENVADIPNAVTTVASIGGKTFDWTDAYINNHGGVDGYFVQKADFGVIAQDVQAVFPRAVRTRDDGMLAVDYEKLSALAFAAIRELSLEMQDLKAKVQDLESKIHSKP